MEIKQNVLLAPYTTFKIGGPARYFCIVRDQFDALEAYEFAKEKRLQTFVLGGGSNILVSDEGFNGLVLKVENSGIEVINQGDDVLLKVASGETWDKVVEFAVKNAWWGMENLSHIPGSTGAIAVQNVGAYGQEASKIIDSVMVFNKEKHNILNIENQDCKFTYRGSIFNQSEKGRYIIFGITFRLKKNGAANLSYRDLKSRFENQTPTLEQIRQAVTEIRDTKFPFPTQAVKGNAGSFFKNPVLTQQEYDNLKNKLASRAEELDAKKFLDDGKIKVPAAFLIDFCGLKDMESGGAAINQNQPLVIINKSGNASAQDVLNLANQVKLKVKEKTGIELIFEPELIGF